jgi:hypothetical protein
MTRRKSLADRAMAAWHEYDGCPVEYMFDRRRKFIRLANQWRRQAEKQKKGKVKRGK